MDRDDLRLMREEFRYLGFRNFPEKEIADKIRADGGKFHIKGEQQFLQYGTKQDMYYEIYFKKYEHQNLYHPYMYQATLKDQPERTQAFRMSNDDTFTAQDAFNLLNGRAVQKLVLDWSERKLVNKWFQLDLTQKDVHGNFKVEDLKVTDQDYQIGAALSKYPIKEMRTPEDRIKLILSLHNGNAEPITLLKDGKEIKGFAEASPKNRTVAVYSQPSKRSIESKISKGKQELRPWELQEQLVKKKKRKGRSI